MQIEKDLEMRFKNEVEKLGGLTYKFTSPGNRGVPDQIAIYKGEVFFVEIKRPNCEPRLLQVAVQNLMKSHGARVRTVSTFEEVQAIVAWIKKVGDRKEKYEGRTS